MASKLPAQHPSVDPSGHDDLLAADQALALVREDTAVVDFATPQVIA